MIFELTEEQKMMQQMVRSFAEEMVKPHAAEIDETDEFPMDIFREAGKLGLLAINMPEKYGGSGADSTAAVIASIEIAKASAAVANIFSSVRHHLFCMYHYGNEEQKQKFIPAMAKGEIIGSFALSESGSGSDASSIKTQAKLDGDEYVINGSKMWITMGNVADFTIVFAVTDPDKGSKGISAFIVEKGTPGFTVGKRERKLGQKGNPVCELMFENVRVPKSCMLGEEGQGIKIALHSLDSGRIEVAALAVGLMQAALEESVNYAENRKQFGQKISSFQLIQAMISEMATDLDAATLLTYRAAYLKDQGKKFTREASMAKWFATEAVMKHTTNAIQIHGGYGYCKDYNVERYFRDAKLTQIFEGTNQIQQIVISREVLKQWAK
ncbi:acyl-CoA dehydrogenase family protein [Neobacillus sp. OS1-32]|uniref:Acyl-CoA dehydrogenase family protein n=1 Tax=Neobacillus paridis TaxID=2803862 RepID=A0ABS1TUE8_9BACI|nr:MULTISPECIES: acyl-CoA dehydrogenase family protein [Neobacillus]MBL4954937.1 acyl-CoA dehydrogenase family protein [Neobacillus paridis]WML30148.1 acyl-CoA dehydrogenase family protein [Neobacillus sp. OS1-32]